MDKSLGKWQVVCWKMNVIGGWKNLKKFTDNQYVMEFHTNGVLTESSIGEHPSRTKFVYCPDKFMLTIDRSDYVDDGFMLACIEENYRIEFLSDRYVVLYDLEGVEVEPDDYTLAVEMEKI